MTDYTITTDFGAKDSLPSGNAAKVIKGSEFTTEFTNILTAVNSKADTAGDTFTGAVTFDAAVTLNADVTFDTNTMFVDVSANKVGIGNVAPATALDVTGVITTDGLTSSAGIDITGTVTASGLTVDTNTLHVDATNDRVGIGTTGPATSLHVLNASDTQIRLSQTGEGSYDLGVVDGDKFAINRDGLTNEFVMSAGNVGIGTDSPTFDSGYNGLHISQTAPSIHLTPTSSGTTASDGYAINVNSSGIVRHINKENQPIEFHTNNTERMRIDSSGNVGIGTTSPVSPLHIQGTDNVAVRIKATGENSLSRLLLQNDGRTWTIDNDGANADALTFYDATAVAERMRIDSSGNVGIGGIPAAVTHGPHLDLVGNRGTLTVGTGYFEDNGNTNFIGGARSLAFGSAGSSTERMRIDASGNVLVGKTTSASSTAGITLEPAGAVVATRDGGECFIANRKTSDGTIIQLRKDQTTVGSIGTTYQSGVRYMHIAGTSTGIGFYSGGIFPCDSSGTFANNSKDLGSSTVKWDDVYATNGTIQTSDRNEKQDIAELSDAEQRVAVACKGLLRKFRWRYAVEEKGDEARIHFGIIAQDLQDAFTAEGLDASDYAMFINSTWTDEETGEERSSMGVRYSELLAFIISAI